MTTQARELAKIVTNAGDLSFSDDITLGSDASVLNFGADSDVTLTHVADTGLLLNSTRQLQFGDSGTYIHQSADGVLDLVSDTEIELNATTLDINANVDISGTLTVAGALDFGDLDISNVGSIALDTITNDGTDITLDSSGDITLDADGGDIRFKDGGNTFGYVASNGADELVIGAGTPDKDIIFKGTDGSTAITPMTIDMSEGGKVGIGTTSPSAVLHVVSDSTSVDALYLESTEASSSAAPVMSFKRHSGSPADADYLGQIKFKGENDADQDVVYAKVTGKAGDVSDGSEDGVIEFANIKAGSATITARLSSTKLDLTNGTALEIGGALTLNDYIEKTSGNLTIDVAGDIILDADGGDFYVKDDGTTLLHLDQYYRLGLGGSATSKLDIHYDSGGFDDSDASSRLASSMMHFQGNNDMRLIFTENGTTYRGMLGYEHAGSSYMGIWDSGSSSTPTLVSQAGKIGIGTTSPGYLIHAAATTTETSMAIQSNMGGTGSAVGGRLRLQLGAQNNSGSGQADTQSGDTLGEVLMEGQGTDYSYQGGSIRCVVTTGDGTATRAEQETALLFGTIKVGATSQVEKMRLTGNGDLCLGGTNDAHTSADIGTSLHILSEESGTDVSLHLHPDNGEWSLYAYNNYLAILDHANNAERWRMDSGGRQRYNGSAGGNGHYNMVGEVGSGYKALAFERTVGGGEVGTIVTNASSTTYNTSSDYRLKENVDYTWDATTRLKQLKPARFNWIADSSNTLLEGFLAHEVSSIVPEAVSGEKDAMTDAILYTDGEVLPSGKNVGDIKTASAPDYQGIDHSKLVPLMVKTIQELEARIATLEG